LNLGDPFQKKICGLPTIGRETNHKVVVLGVPFFMITHRNEKENRKIENNKPKEAGNKHEKAKTKFWTKNLVGPWSRFNPVQPIT
jgi:hypothetical protein